jgi:4'-phosphopantetheinyl transferase
VIAQLSANAPDPWPLRAGVVHVWRFACAQDPGPHARALSADERAIAANFVAPHHRDVYVAQHALVRALVARYVAIAPEAIAFARRARGKRYIAGGAAIEFNLAHCDDLALLAIAPRELAVGIDIERLDADLDARQLGRIVLARDERFVAADRRGFLRVWCRKEACLKATGVGLLDDLAAVSVAADRVDVAGEVVHVQDLAIDGDHAAALATTAPIGADWRWSAAETI